MSYIGTPPTQQAFTPAVDFFNGNGSTTAFTLSRPVASVAQVQAVISNVPQKPGDAFTVSGNTITFTSAPPSGTQNIYVYYTSPITQVIAPGQGTVSTASLAANSVTGSGAMALASLPSFTTTIGVGGATASASGSGITFPATQSASSDANTLDDYEEGTWTPTVGDAVSGGNQATLSASAGFYTKIGRVVQFSLRIQMSSKASMNAGNTLWIRGLPFAIGSGFVRSLTPAYVDGATFTGYVIGEPASATAAIDFVICASGASAASLAVSGITNSFFTIIQGTYQTD